MGPAERATYYLYSTAYDPRDLTLGTLVLRDYANPTQTLRCTHHPLSSKELEEHATIRSVSGTFAKGHASTPGLSLEVADIVNFDASWTHNDSTIVQAEKGTRIQLRDPQKFLNDNVLFQDSPAARELRIWLTAARSSYVLRRAAFRKPRVWLLTGIYLLSEVQVLVNKGQAQKFGVGASSLVLSQAGVPLGASVHVDFRNASTTATNTTEESVWAAQWRLIDAQYINGSRQGSLPDFPLEFRLFYDRTSKGTVRAGGDSDEIATAFAVRLNGDDGEAEARSTRQENDDYTETEWSTFVEAVEKFRKWVQ